MFIWQSEKCFMVSQSSVNLGEVSRIVLGNYRKRLQLYKKHTKFLYIISIIAKQDVVADVKGSGLTVPETGKLMSAR